MRGQVISVGAVFITLAVLYLAGVLLLLDPVAAREEASAHLLPLPLAFLIAIAVYTALFVWLERAIGDPFKAALAIVLSQMALVNVDFVLSGKRRDGSRRYGDLVYQLECRCLGLWTSQTETSMNRLQTNSAGWGRGNRRSIGGIVTAWKSKLVIARAS